MGVEYKKSGLIALAGLDNVIDRMGILKQIAIAI